MLYLVGLGLCDPKDITVKGLEIVRNADRVYLEAYTSCLSVNQAQLEDFYGRPVLLADRETVEQNADEILENADKESVVFLVVGDPLGATTHSDLILRATERNISYQVVHNASIINAVGCCGLQLYSYGETVSIPYWTESWKPDSFIDRIEQNSSHDQHTLCLLDIKVKELSVEHLMKGKRVYEEPRYMTVSQASKQIMEAIEARKDPLKHLSLRSRCVGLARIGAPDQTIAVDTLANIGSWDLGGPLHSLVIVGRTHPLEDQMLSAVCNAKPFRE